MGKKKFLIAMDPEAHKRLKKRAKQIGIPIGLMVENMLSAYEFRLSRATKVANLGRVLSDFVGPLTLAMWTADQHGHSESKLVERFREIGLEADQYDDEWEPRISISTPVGSMEYPGNKK